MRQFTPWQIFAGLATILIVGVGLWWWQGRAGSGDAGRVAQADDVAVPATQAPETAVLGDPTATPTAANSAPVAEQTLADVLEEIGDLSVPGNRERAVARMREIERKKRIAAVEQAQKLGLPLRVTRPDGTVQELAGFENGRPVYFTTHNANAAISTGANLLRNAPYSLSGSGMTVGLWDGGSARATHQEFASGSRVVVKDGSAAIDHATHVAGTIAAAGVVTSARGMAPAAIVDSYDWNSDKSEMTARAAAAPGEVGRLYLSNHSYGYVSGWNYVGGTGSPARLWEWYGDGTVTTSYEYDFGRYNTYSRDSDSLAYSAPYFLMFRSAGNETTDNPSNGDAVALAPGSSTVVSYSSSSHPAGDGAYRGGFETVSFDALGKNVITVGSTTDAVSGGVRSPSSANISSFSSWGPTDDGRIKPDIVANGDGVYSSLNGSDASYGTYSGTSMSTPNASGTATLLMEEYGRVFPGGAMRSSTLKGLLIQTADDRGNTGPDYKYGWGLISGVAAVNLIRDHAANPLKVRMNEGLITNTTTTVNHDFVWDGVSPIRATLCWTDPAGTATTTNDLRTARLVNNLQLKITGPAGSEYLPYVMPFVGTWTQASMALPASTGVNNVDNVEQVFVASPPARGVYRCVITYSGTLANNQQNYSLLISGSANEEPPPPPLAITSITPSSALPGAVTMDLTGTSFKTGATVKLTRSGQPDISATSVTFNSATSLRSQFSLAGAAAGLWSVTVTNPDSATFTLADAFTLVGALWSESFDGALSGWTSAATTGTNAWALTTAQSHSPTSCYFAPGPSSKTTCSLTSPAVAIPGNGTSMQFIFWHSYNLQSTRDAGKLEFSLDGGTWFDVIASGSGASFASNGYNATISSSGPPSSRNEFAGQQAWSGNSSGFIQTVINLTDTAKYAGHSLRARWRIATNSSTASVGWYVDSISLIGGGNQSNQAPVLTTAATSTSAETVTDADSTVFQIVRGQGIGLSVAASDDGGESALTYTWSGSHSGSVAPSFTVNATNAAKNTTALFEATGDYLLTVTVRDAQGLASSSSVNVRVLQTASDISVTPAVASVSVSGQQVFSAALLDQFGDPMSSQPPSFGWTVSAGGSINSAGLFTATTAVGPAVVTATSSPLSGIASVTVNPAPATVTLGSLTQTYDGSPKPVSHTTTPAGLAVAVTYAGSSTAPNAVGSYAVVATITDPNYQGGTTGTLVIQPRQFILSVAASPVEGGSVSGAGSFEEGITTPITATAAQGWRFTGWTGSSITAPANASTTVLVDAAKSVTATFTELSTYEQWAAAQGLNGDAAAMLADPDGDGLANLLEYALGSDPKTRTASPGAQVELDTADPPQNRLTLRFTRPKNLPGVTYHAWATSNLTDWLQITDIVLQSAPEDATETVIARDSQPVNSGARFMRLEVRAVP